MSSSSSLLWPRACLASDKTMPRRHGRGCDRHAHPDNILCRSSLYRGRWPEPMAFHQELGNNCVSLDPINE